MLIRDGIVLLEFADLVNDGCLTRHTYDKGVRDGRITVVQKGGGGHPALIDWASLAPRYQDMVRHHLGGDPVVLAKSQTLQQHMKLRPDDGRYIDEFKGRTGLMLTEEKRRALRQACKVMAFLDELHDMPQALIRSEFGVASVLDLKRSILDYIKANGIDLPHSFPRLEERKRAYRQCRAEGLPGAAGLVHGGHGNKNRSRIQDPFQGKVLERLAMDPRNLSYAAIAKLYNAVAVYQRLPSMGVNTVAAYLKQGEVARAVTLHGKGKALYQDTFGMVIKRGRPTKPSFLWVHDATVYELYYQRTEKGKTNHWHRKHVCVVLDPFNDYPVGYAIGESDTVELTKAAVKSAVEHTLELTGHYVLPHQVQSDKLGATQLRQWYEGMGVIYTPAAARNARAKAIESWFNRHHTEHVQPYYINWGGHNITASRRRQPNPDALEANKHLFPNEATVIGQIHEAIARERASKAEAYRAGLLSLGERLVPAPRAQFLEHFGTRHSHTNTLTNKGLCPTIDGVERWYNLLEVDLQNHIGKSFQVTYDPADLSTVLASTDGGKVRFLVEAQELVPMALADHTPQSRARLQAFAAFKLEVSQGAIDRGGIRHQVDEVLKRMLLPAMEAVELPAKGRKRRKATDEEPSQRIGPMEEAVIRAYATTNGSHKEALREAQSALPAVSINPEQWALDNL